MGDIVRMGDSNREQPNAAGRTAAELDAMAVEREAYLGYLGLTRNPFPVVPDAENFFLPARLDVLITELLHSIYTRKGFMVLTGEVGLGKTTISRRLLHVLSERRVETALVFNTLVEGAELLQEINRDFGIEMRVDGLKDNLTLLNDFLLQRYSEGVNCAIIIDDAQNLSTRNLELVRMISNLETNAHKLVQIVLIGQPELLEKLDSHELRQLKSRVVVNARVRPFDLEELKQYIYFRLNTAGGGAQVQIAESAFRLIHELTGGTPRLVNILMERCLYGLFAYQTSRIGRKLVLEVGAEIELHRKRRRIPVKGIAASVFAAALAGAGALAITTDFNPFAALGENRAPIEISQARAEAARAAAARAAAEKERAEAETALAEALTQQKQAEAEAARAQALAEKAAAEARAARERAQADASRAEAETATALAEARSAQRAAQAEAERARAEAEAMRAEAERARNLAATLPAKAAIVVPKELKAFLEGYDLDHYAEMMAESLRDGWLPLAAERIAERTGYRLVQLQTVPEQAVFEGPVYTITPPTGAGEKIFFWKPPAWVDSFHYGHRSNPVRRMQQALAGLGLYPADAVDGVVGKYTMKALMAFQDGSGLEVTGIPDATTQYLLHLEAGKGGRS